MFGLSGGHPAPDIEHPVTSPARPGEHRNVVTDSARNEVTTLVNAKAETWSTKYATGGPLGDRLAMFFDALHRCAPLPAAVLDLGCGTGELARFLERQGYRAVGCDFSPGMIERARASSLPESGVEWVTLAEDWRTLPFATGRFQAIVASSVFEYLDDVPGVAAECFRVLQPNGVLILTVPDRDHPIRKLEGVLRSFLTRGSVRHSWIGLVPRVSNYAVYLTISRNRWPLDQWIATLAAAGFEAPAGIPEPAGRRSAHRARTALRLLVLRRGPALDVEQPVQAAPAVSCRASPTSAHPDRDLPPSTRLVHPACSCGSPWRGSVG